MDESTQDDASIARALEIAGELIDAGVPVFAAPPCPAANGGTCGRDGHAAGGQEYDLPPKWQMTIASRTWLEKWKPGHALAAVGGRTADFLDEDPRNGGDASITEMVQCGEMPRVFGVQGTPSGGRHYVISPLAENKSTGFMPGLDYQGGALDGQGRGFVWIAPTAKRSKTDNVRRAYVWAQEPDMDYLAEFNGDGFTDDSCDGLRGRLEAYRSRRREKLDRSATGAPREFTRAQAEHFWEAPRLALATAEIGQIEDRANAFACTLSHFVPSMLSEESAYRLLADALGETAYDPNHPASGWTAEKFYAVVGGEAGRAPGDWYAVVKPETLEQAQELVTGDEVTALLAEMLTPDAVARRPSPQYMIKGLLTYDTTAWLIGGPGSKKSFLALDFAAHVALGRAWQGRRVNKGLVVIIAGEGAGSIGKRVDAWQREYGPMPADAIRILPRPVQAGKPEKWAVLVEACRRIRAHLAGELGMFVVIDTQARATVGMDENSAEEMGVYVAAVDAIRTATRGCVLSVHHTTKAGDSTRGSSALDGAQDTRLKMDSKPKTLVGKLFVQKQKDIEESDPIEIAFRRVELGKDADGDEVDSLVIAPHDAIGSAYAGSLFSADEAAREAAARVEPFLAVGQPESWTARVVPPEAIQQRRILQVLASVAGERGLTKAEALKVYTEKWGEVRRSSFYYAFNKITELEMVVSGGGGSAHFALDEVELKAVQSTE